MSDRLAHNTAEREFETQRDPGQAHPGLARHGFGLAERWNRALHAKCVMKTAQSGTFRGRDRGHYRRFAPLERTGFVLNAPAKHCKCGAPVLRLSNKSARRTHGEMQW